jgi:phosphopantothenoylcysteine synthetase/decarboxylase
MTKKHVVLAVTGSIAAYKAPDIVRRLQEGGADVTVLMTPGAERFITPLTFETLTRRPVYRDMFTQTGEWSATHVALAQAADVYLIAPATADIIAKIACGIADDLVACMAVATIKPIIIAPAMNDGMFANRIVQENIAKLKKLGMTFVDPKESKLACGTVGRGALADVDVIVKAVIDLL